MSWIHYITYMSSDRRMLLQIFQIREVQVQERHILWVNNQCSIYTYIRYCLINAVITQRMENLNEEEDILLLESVSNWDWTVSPQTVTFPFLRNRININISNFIWKRNQFDSLRIDKREQSFHLVRINFRWVELF